jgi:hypothetical protein
MAELMQASLCSFGLTKTLNFILRFLAMAELMQASLCSFGLTKTLDFFFGVEAFACERADKRF